MTGLTPDKLPKALDTFVRELEVELALDTFREAAFWVKKKRKEKEG